MLNPFEGELLDNKKEENEEIIDSYFEEEELRKNPVLKKAVELLHDAGLTPEKIGELDLEEFLMEVEDIPGYDEAFYAENLREKSINPLGEEILKSLEGKSYEDIEDYILNASEEQVEALYETTKEKLGEKWAVGKDSWVRFKESPELMVELNEFKERFIELLYQLGEESKAYSVFKDHLSKSEDEEILEALENNDFSELSSLISDHYDLRNAFKGDENLDKFFKEKFLPVLKERENDEELEIMAKCFSEWFFEDMVLPEFLSFNLDTVNDICSIYEENLGREIRPDLPGGWWR